VTRWDYFPMSAGPCAPAPDVQGGWQITSYFGGRIDPIDGTVGTHGGQDMAYSGCRGAELYAPSAGTLSQSWDPSGGGNWSGITLDDGSYIGLGHALSFAPGDRYRRVGAGELIAYCDSTGGSTGDHVHVAYRPAGSYSYADPYDLLAECQHRHPGGDEMTDDDWARLEQIVDASINDALRTSYTGARALACDGEPGIFELVITGEGRIARRHIPTPDQVKMLQWVDHLAGTGDGATRKITDPAMRAAFLALPVVS